MSNFLCDKCGKAILDSPVGYETGCKHYPLKHKFHIHKYEEIEYNISTITAYYKKCKICGKLKYKSMEKKKEIILSNKKDL